MQRAHMHVVELLKTLVEEIRKGHYPNKQQLAYVIGRNKRSVQRYLEALRRMDAPLEYDSSKKGFYFTKPEWTLSSIALTEGELISFFTAERFLRRLGMNQESLKLRSALSRMSKLMPEEVIVDLGVLESVLDFEPEPALETSPLILQRLTQAARKRQTIEIDYYTLRTGKQAIRQVDVLCVHNYLGEWYAVCYDHKSNEIRDFNAGRIKGLQETSRSFKLPAGWNREEYLRKGFGMFRGGKPVRVIVEFDADQARYVRERCYHPTQQLQELPNGGVRATLEVTEAALGQVARWLLTYGEHVRVIEPESLRKMLINTYKKALELYEGE